MSRPLRVYVAGASAEPERVRWAVAAVRAMGAEVAIDWLAAIEEAGAANEGLTDADRVRYAQDDLCAVEDADVMWLLAPVEPSAGAWVELGYALALAANKRAPDRIVVSGSARVRCIFAALADEEHDRDEDALASLLRALEGGA
jgi:nucleoside 2-deoxyribosyltransferase